MKVTTFSNNLFQLTRLVAFNCYLVREDDGFTLIDTNMGGQAQAIMQEASKLGLPITRIVLTHAHVDHVGSLDALHEALPDVQVAISERDARFLTGDKQSPCAVVANSITAREREVLVRIAQGQSNKAIARDLGLSPKTVEKHRSNLMRKLQLHNAAAITMYAIRNGLSGSDPAGVPPQV